MVKSNATGLGIIGVLLFFGSITHDILSIHFGHGTVGPVDILFSVTGIVFMIPLISLVSKQETIATYMGWVGIITVVVTLTHDALGVYISPSTSIGPVDSLVWLAGIMLMMPYLLSLSK